MQMYSFRDANIRKTWALFVLFLLVIIGVGWVFSYIWQSPVILYIAVAFSIVMNITAYWKSDSIALSLSRAKEADQTEYRELYRIVDNLCISQGMPSPRVFIIDDKSENAFAAGRNPSHAVIALTTGIIDVLDRSELEGVIAHELSHIKNYDTLLSTAAVVLVGFLSIASDIFLRSMWFRGNDRRNGGGGILMLVGIVLAILAPLAGVLMQLAISRKREYLADASGALMTRYPEGLASALQKIALSPPMRNARTATAHLFFANPFKKDTANPAKNSFLAGLFMTHPPIQARIAKLREM